MRSNQNQLPNSSVLTIPSRDAAEDLYEFVLPIIDSGARPGDFWTELTDWTCSNGINSSLQKAVQINQASVDTHMWYHNLMRPVDAPFVRGEIFTTVRSVRRTIQKHSPEALDLNAVDITQCHPKHLIAVLRSSYPWKDKVPGWGVALSKAPEVLERAGINARRELAGLDR